MKLKIKTIFIILITIINLVFGQINTEVMRKIKNQDGLSAQLDYNYNIIKGNSEYISHNANFKILYKKGKFNSFLITNYEQKGTNNKQIINKGFMHLRSVRETGQKFSLESFIQNEFDNFLFIENRLLIGGGGRFLALNKEDKLTFYLGIGGMYEGEKYSISSEKDKNLFRSTNYFTGTWMLDEKISLSYTQYLQFDTGRLSDYRLLTDLNLEVALLKRLSLVTIINYRYDNEPVLNLKKYDFSIINGLSINF